MSNFVVTGCAGLIGSNVSRMLISEGHSVIVIDSLNKSCDIRLKEWMLSEILKSSKFDFVNLPYRTKKHLRQNSKIYAFYHLFFPSSIPPFFSRHSISHFPFFERERNERELLSHAPPTRAKPRWLEPGGGIYTHL